MRTALAFFQHENIWQSARLGIFKKSIKQTVYVVYSKHSPKEQQNGRLMYVAHVPWQHDRH